MLFTVTGPELSYRQNPPCFCLWRHFLFWSRQNNCLFVCDCANSTHKIRLGVRYTLLKGKSTLKHVKLVGAVFWLFPWELGGCLGSLMSQEDIASTITMEFNKRRNAVLKHKWRWSDFAVSSKKKRTRASFLIYHFPVTFNVILMRNPIEN